MADTDLITINKADLIIAQNEAGDFVVTPKAEEQLKKILAAKLLIEEIIMYAKETLGKAMIEQNLIKIQGGEISVSRRFFGDRFEITDPNIAESLGIAKQETKYKIDTTAVDRYLKEHEGQLPEGIKLRDRVESVTISSKKGGDKNGTEEGN